MGLDRATDAAKHSAQNETVWHPRYVTWMGFLSLQLEEWAWGARLLDQVRVGAGSNLCLTAVCRYLAVYKLMVRVSPASSTSPGTIFPTFAPSCLTVTLWSFAQEFKLFRYDDIFCSHL